MNKLSLTTSNVRALIMSDLHLEFEASVGLEPGESLPPLPNESNYDLIILAGDIALAGDVSNRYEHLFKYFKRLNELGKPILFVIGNHELYLSYNFGHLGEVLSEKLTGPEFSNIHVLDRSTFKFNGITFIGATLWTDFGGGDKDVMANAQASMSDYNVIATPERKKIKPQDVLKAHKIDRKYIFSQLESLGGRSCVVITHHAPVECSDISLKLPEAYQSDLSEKIRNYKPLFWIHGHIHKSIDLLVADTRMICNPRGYIAHKREEKTGNKTCVPEKINPDFNPELIVNITMQGI